MFFFSIDSRSVIGWHFGQLHRVVRGEQPREREAGLSQHVTHTRREITIEARAIDEGLTVVQAEGIPWP